MIGVCRMDQKNILNRSTGIYAICLLILVAGGLYLNSLGNLFTNWDDSMIYANPQIESLDWRNILEIFTLREGATYQPIRMLSYAIDYRFWKLNPLGYRITNVLFYILTCIMVFFTLWLLSCNLRERGSRILIYVWDYLVRSFLPPILCTWRL